MAAIHLIRSDTETLPNHAPHEVSREEAVVTAKEKARRHVRPSRERPGLLERGARLPAFSFCERLLYHIRRDVVEELAHDVEFSVDVTAVPPGLVAPGLFPIRVGPPGTRLLTGHQHHGGDENH